MKTLPTLTLSALLAAVGVCGLWQAEILSAQPPEKTEAKAAAGAEDTPAPTSEAASDVNPQEFLRTSVDRLKTYKWITSKVVLSLNLMNYGFAGEGEYIVGPENRMRYEIKIELPHTTGRLLEVSDGEILYTRHEILPKSSQKKDTKPAGKEKDKARVDLLKPEITVTRRNVKTILSHLQRQPDPNLYQRWIVDLGFGGLPALMASLDKSMEFTTARNDTVRGHTVTVLEGTWTDAQRNVWMSQGQTELPPIVPDLCRIAFDQETRFPLRVVFLKRIPDSKGLRTMVTLDFVDVKLDEPVDAAIFTYKEDLDHPARELTEAVIDEIQRAGQQGTSP